MVLLVGSVLACTTVGCATYVYGSALPLKAEAPETIPLIVVPVSTDPLAPSVPPIPPPEKKSFGKRIVGLFRGAKKEVEPAAVTPSPDAKPLAIPPDVKKSTIESTGGADIREIEGGIVTFRYEAGRLKAELSLRVKGQAEPLVLRAEADYSRGKVSNAVGHVEYPKPFQPTSPVEAAGFGAKPNRVEAPSKIPPARDLEILPMPKPASRSFSGVPTFRRTEREFR